MNLPYNYLLYKLLFQWFGSELLQFHSVGAAFVTLVAILRGDSQVLVAMGEAHLGFSIVFIAVYLSAILFGVHSLIAGTFSVTYGITKKQVNYHNPIKAHDHEIISFLMKRLRRFIQKDKSKAVSSIPQTVFMMLFHYGDVSTVFGDSMTI